jgi:Zn-dependent alcohol dehydrogenase
MRIKAAVLGVVGALAPYALSTPLLIEELELDPPGPGEVLVRLPVDRLMSGTLPLAAINEGFDRLHDGTAIRQVVTL